MAKTFDATLKELVDRFGTDWTGFLCHRLGLPNDTRAEPLDADLSVFSPQADKLFRLSGPTGGILHLELESTWAGEIPDRLLVYNVLAEHRHGGPVYSVVMLLRPEANATAVTGALVRSGETGEYLRFRYTVVRLWELPSAELIAGPVGVLPLALLTNDAQANLPSLIPQVDDRVTQELGQTAEAEIVRTAFMFLLGLRYDKNELRQLFEGVMQKHESSAYEMLMDMGQEKALHRILLRMGRKKLGPPSTQIESALNKIVEIDRLDRMVDALDQAKTWDDLLNS